MRGKQAGFSEIWKEVSDECVEQYGIKTGNNARFVSEIIFKEVPNKSYFAYAECGVYKGTTFVPIYHLCKKLFQDFIVYALDSFSGFPDEVVLNENDEFEKFEMLHRGGRITKDHLERARERCKKLQKKEHLQQRYFETYADDFFEKCKGKHEIIVVKCSFGDLGTDFQQCRGKYDLVFLDCDMYLSYVSCLDYFKDKTDIFIFDEYYSLKYPGARIACDAFVEKNHNWEFFSKIEADPYFERWGIRKKA